MATLEFSVLPHTHNTIKQGFHCLHSSAVLGSGVASPSRMKHIGVNLLIVFGKRWTIFVFKWHARMTILVLSAKYYTSKLISHVHSFHPGSKPSTLKRFRGLIQNKVILIDVNFSFDCNFSVTLHDSRWPRAHKKNQFITRSIHWYNTQSLLFVNNIFKLSREATYPQNMKQKTGSDNWYYWKKGSLRLNYRRLEGYGGTSSGLFLGVSVFYITNTLHHRFLICKFLRPSKNPWTHLTKSQILSKSDLFSLGQGKTHALLFFILT